MRQDILCPCCGQGANQIQPQLLDRLKTLESEIGPVKISSGYRCPAHNKSVGGEPDSAHVTGYAIDISCGADGKYARRVLSHALPIFNRIGISAKTGSTAKFIHMDCAPNLPQPCIWSY